MKSPSVYRSEDALHQACAGYLNARLLPPAWWTTFPAGGGGKDRGSRLKRMGMKSGVPDLLIFDPLPVMGIMGYGIELKDKDGRLLPSQIETQPRMMNAGFQIMSICRSLEEMKHQLDEWRIPIRHVSPATERLMLSLNAWQEANFDLSSL